MRRIMVSLFTYIYNHRREQSNFAGRHSRVPFLSNLTGIYHYYSIFSRLSWPVKRCFPRV